MGVAEIQRMLVDQAMPFYKLWIGIEKGYTSGDGYLDKLCMELVGFDFSRCRPPIATCACSIATDAAR